MTVVPKAQTPSQQLQLFWPLGGLPLDMILPSRFMRSVLLLASGTVVAQVILLLGAPVLTRLYRPEDLGTLAVFMSVVSLLAVLAALRYEVAIPLPRDECQAANILVLSLLSVTVVTTITTLTIWLFGGKTLRWAGIDMPTPLLWLVPLGLLVTGLHATLSTWMVRRRDYQQLALNSVMQSFCQMILQIALGFGGFGPLGLAAGDTTGRVCSCGILLRRSWRTSGGSFRLVTVAGIASAAKRYWRFPAFSSWAALLNTAAIHLPTILFALLYDVRVVGWLALAQRLLGTPTTLLSSSIAKVYFSECARLRHEAPERLPQLFYKTLLTQVALAIPLVICIALPAPWLCGLLFGQEWTPAGWCVLGLSVMFAAKLIAYPLGSTLDVFEMQGWHILRELSRVILMVIAVAIAAIWNLSPFMAIALLSVLSMIAYFLGIVIVWYVLKGASPAHET